MVFEKTIEEVVEENFIYARALHYLGIDFFHNASKKLNEVCKERGIEKHRVIKSFYDFDSSSRMSFNELSMLPIDLVIEYLKHTHHVFIKEKLPFIIHLAKKSNEPEIYNLLPEFVEELIKHIYEEEDNIFEYTQLLSSIQRKKEKHATAKLLKFSKFSLKDAYKHHKDEDDLEAIKSLLGLLEDSNLRGRVLLKELKAFDREMIYHAAIENQIFFPKAISLEKEVLAKIDILSKLN